MHGSAGNVMGVTSPETAHVTTHSQSSLIQCCLGAKPRGFVDKYINELQRIQFAPNIRNLSNYKINNEARRLHVVIPHKPDKRSSKELGILNSQVDQSL